MRKLCVLEFTPNESLDKMQYCLNLFLHYYNWQRKHRGLGMDGATPIRRLRELGSVNLTLQCYILVHEKSKDKIFALFIIFNKLVPTNQTLVPVLFPFLPEIYSLPHVQKSIHWLNADIHREEIENLLILTLGFFLKNRHPIFFCFFVFHRNLLFICWVSQRTK